ncbi:LapA family protein [Arthrobacter sp. CG_A4]|uniref:LapA family protein n=1 Tax=Arthrobacter sp. CG_A4 TaxID=3071706 RepID=UPI002DF7CEAB|nr:putative integral membrane protein [Arthrobacter sp. CG_A4]
MTQTPSGFEPTDPAAARQPGTPDALSGYAGDDSTAATRSGVEAVPDTEPAAVEAPRPAADKAEPAAGPGPEPRQVTRAGMVWAAVASALVVLILLIAFILQNQDYVQVKFFGLQGAVPLGIALFIAAVGGGVLVAIAGAARIIQLRIAAHRQRVRATGRR